jgi:hypothetical protein
VKAIEVIVVRNGPPSSISSWSAPTAFKKGLAHNERGSENTRDSTNENTTEKLEMCEKVVEKQKFHEYSYCETKHIRAFF